MGFQETKHKMNKNVSVSNSNWQSAIPTPDSHANCLLFCRCFLRCGRRKKRQYSMTHSIKFYNKNKKGRFEALRNKKNYRKRRRYLLSMKNMSMSIEKQGQGTGWNHCQVLIFLVIPVVNHEKSACEN